jgi:hypothetical protein
LHLQVSVSEAALISVGLFVFSVLTSTPFAVITKLKKMFEEPGDYDYIAFCVEDLPQLGQVNTKYISYIGRIFCKQCCLSE